MSLYASQDEAFRLLELARERFGPDDADLATLIDGEDVVSREVLLALGRYVEALRADPAINAVASPLDARQPLVLGDRTCYLPIVSEDALSRSDEDRHAALRRRLIEHPALADRLVSSDGRSLLVVATLGESSRVLPREDAALERVRSLATGCFEGLPVRVRVTGAPALRVETFHRLKAGLVRSSLIGCGVLLLIAALAFPRAGDFAAVLLGPATGTVWLLGMMGWSGEPLDGLNVVLPSLLFAIGFTDSVHLKLTRVSRSSRWRSPLSVLGKVGPACFCTSLTTAVGFGSLQLSTLESVQRFGLLAAVGAMVQCLAVAGAHALLAFASHPPSDAPRPWFHRAATRGMLRVGAWVADRTLTLSVSGVVALTVLAFATQGAKFDMNWSETLPTRGDTKSTLDDIDRVFGGSVPARLVVRWPAGMSALDSRVLGCLGDLTEGLTKSRRLGLTIGEPTSILTLADALVETRGEPAKEIRFAWKRAPDQVRRWLAPRERQALIAIPLPDIGAARLARLFAEIDTRVAAALLRYPGFSARLTGTPVIAARNLGNIARELTASVLFAGVAVVTILGFTLRSARLGLATIVPNVLPLAVVVAALVATDSPLRITVALTLCLAVGLGVDDTIHLASSLRRQRRRGATARRACLAACRQTGPAILLTTIVLVAVLLAIAWSDSPAIRSFGCLGALSLVVSAIGAFVLLPAYALTVEPSTGSRAARRSYVALSKRSATA